MSNDGRRWRKLVVGAAISATAVALPGTTALVQAQPLAAGRLAPAPAVLAVHALPGALPAKGGAVEVLGKVRGATTCHLAVLKDPTHGAGGVKVTLPKPASCASGSYREHVGFGPNGAKLAVVVKLGLFASGPSASAHGVFYVVVTPAPRPTSTAHPAVVSAKASPWKLGYQGGTVTVEGKVSGAKVCRLAVLDNPGVEVRLPKPAGCAKGTYDQKVTFGPNHRYGAVNVELALFPYGLVKKYDGAFYVSLAGRPKPVPTTTTPPLPPATTTPVTQPSAVPPPAIGGGGGAPFPPPPPAPSSPATTTTTVPPASTTTTTTAPPPPTLTASASTVQQAQSANWSGYAVTGPQPYTSATGTFTVTGLTSSDTCNQMTGEWVGIDGISSSGNPDAWLIQAGVGVYVSKYANGQCEPSNTYGVYPWWEVITPNGAPPAAAIINWDQGPLSGSPATVNIGDQVTVTIGQVADSACSPATECWQIEVTDDTTGGVYVTDQPYAGPGASAEWVVENPDQTSNPNCPAYSYPNETLYLCPPADFSPAVQWSGLSATPNAASGWTELSMTMPGCSGSCQAVYQPSALATNPSLGFSVSYTGSGTTGADVAGPTWDRASGPRTSRLRTLGTPLSSR